MSSEFARRAREALHKIETAGVKTEQISISWIPAPKFEVLPEETKARRKELVQILNSYREGKPTGRLSREEAAMLQKVAECLPELQSIRQDLDGFEKLGQREVDISVLTNLNQPLINKLRHHLYWVENSPKAVRLAAAALRAALRKQWAYILGQLIGHFQLQILEFCHEQHICVDDALRQKADSAIRELFAAQLNSSPPAPSLPAGCHGVLARISEGFYVIATTPGSEFAFAHELQHVAQRILSNLPKEKAAIKVKTENYQ